MSATLLLADDSVTVQRVIELTFADEGMRVVAVGDGAEAIARLEEVAPDIVLADVNMPERDGYEVAAYVKRHPTMGRVPVVLLTGAFDALDERRAAEAGYDGVLAKPFEPHAVIALVRDLLARRREGREGDDETAPGAREAHAGAPETWSSRQETAGPATPASEYFRRLDEAFARGGTAVASGATATGTTSPVMAASAAPGMSPAASAAGVPRSRPEMETSSGAGPGVAAGTGTDAGAVAPQEALSPSPAGSLRGLADAFDWLLGDEVGASPGPAPFLAPNALDEAFVDAVARRVVERLGEPVVRELVTRDVLTLAERLVREEIERLKRQ